MNGSCEGVSGRGSVRGNSKSEVGGRKWEVGSGKWEVGGGKWEVGSGNYFGLSLRNQEASRRLVSELTCNIPLVY